ncbi:hypothetical protein [Mucilaginibacter paludis]|uniref:Uncharacterized protein n=1 Tax=Mucilaginibacter paludis DSM 18603 TaxID=714943 RepID=H1Y1P5_9SPHI|nr:hypothetical protein [Mucilaginibacter paludis]EHQ24704.1 hypothetical protein Mucpa_0512 [Mucilaginibacter paludis DSM 18603]
MMQQAKELRQRLNKIGATACCGSKVRIRTEINRIGPSLYEYGRAVAFTDSLTDEQRTIILAANLYARIIYDRMGCLLNSDAIAMASAVY